MGMIAPSKYSLPQTKFKRLSNFPLQLGLVCLVWAFAACAPKGVAQANMESGQTAQNQPVVVAPSASAQSTATIYVYREGKMFGAGVRPLVFTEGKFLAVLRNSNFAERKVSAGPVIVAAPPFSEQTERNSVYAALDQYFPPNLRWPVCKGDVKKPSCSWQGVVDDPKEEIHGCPKLDWKRLDLASGEDIVLCYKELYSTSAALDNYLDPNRKFKEMILGIAIPGFMGRNLMMDAASIPGGDFSQWLQMCGPDLFQKHTTEDAKEAGSNSKRGAKTEAWNSCKNAVDAGVLSLTANKRILVNTEAGKTYYVRWSVGHFGAGGELELVDEATGAKEMKGLHPAEDK